VGPPARVADVSGDAQNAFYQRPSWLNQVGDRKLVRIPSRHSPGPEIKMSGLTLIFIIILSKCINLLTQPVILIHLRWVAITLINPRHDKTDTSGQNHRNPWKQNLSPGHRIVMPGTTIHKTKTRRTVREETRTARTDRVSNFYVTSGPAKTRFREPLMMNHGLALRRTGKNQTEIQNWLFSPVSG
jgi:hypothetical protein